MTKALKWLYILTIVLTFSLLIPSILLSKEGEKKDPLEITSERMRSEDGGIKIIFEVAVLVALFILNLSYFDIKNFMVTLIFGT